MNLGVAADHVGERGRAAAVVHRREPDARHALEADGVEVARRADAERTVIQFTGLRFGERDEFRDRVCRHRGMHHQRLRNGAEPADRHEVLRLVGELAIKERIDSERRFRSREERVAVGRGLGYRLGADLRVGTALILDDDLLAPHLGEPLAHRTRDHVGRAASGQRHDDPHGLCRIALCPRLRRDRCRAWQQENERERAQHACCHALFTDG